MPYYKELLFSLFARVSFKLQLNSSALALSLYHVEALLASTSHKHLVSAMASCFPEALSGLKAP